MPSPNDFARVLVAVDLSPQTEEALRCAEELRASRATAIDVFYLWSDDAPPPADPADRAIAAIATFARTGGAWDRLDHLDRLARRGVVQVPGWLTRACRGGGSLAEIAGREGYDLVVVGLAQPPHPSHRFDLHRLGALLAVVALAACSACASPEATARSRATIPSNDSARAAGMSDTHITDPRGGADMPGKGRGSEDHKTRR